MGSYRVFNNQCRHAEMWGGSEGHWSFQGMISIVRTANEFQLESQIQLIGSGLKEYCDQITRLAMDREKESGAGYIF